MSKSKNNPASLELSRFKEALQIIHTGKDSKGNHFNNIGTLNQAAWLGENAGVLIKEIERLNIVVADILVALEMARHILGHEARDSKYDNAKEKISAAINKATGSV